MTVTGAHTETTLARRAMPIDALECWRCEGPLDDDAFCSACGAVTIPSNPSRPPGGPIPIPTRERGAHGLAPHARDHRRDGRSDRRAARDLRPPALAAGTDTFDALVAGLELGDGCEVDEAA